MLNMPFTIRKTSKLITYQLRSVHFSGKNNRIDIHVKNDFLKNPTDENLEKFQKDHFPTHWLHKYLPKFGSFISSGDTLKVYDVEKEHEQGRFAWNSNGCYQNRLANIFYRSPALQNVHVMRFFRYFFEHRHVAELNKAEEQPKISPNSVFLYKDPSNYIIHRRSAERYMVFLLLTQAWTAPAALMYIYLAFYFNVLQKVVGTSLNMVFRMDLIPETEQIHFLKIGLFGLPRSIVVNVKDLEKITKEQDNRIAKKWFKTRLWIPRENTEIIYRNIKTGEVFTFNNKGIWNESGLNHKLIN